MYKVAMVLSGCGVMDGSEIHEAVLSCLSLEKRGCGISFFAPDISQRDVVNHFDNTSLKESRNVLIESARIALGKIKSLKDLNMKDFDGLYFPGGFGAAKNICDYALKSADCTVNGDVKKIILQAHDLGKPIAAICIAPVILAKVLGERARVTLTIGTDQNTADSISAMGCRHKTCTFDSAVFDEEHLVVTSPAYMLASGINELFMSTEATAEKFVDYLKC
jgi:enhancing lycopene biosynthesis protein 2